MIVSMLYNYATKDRLVLTTGGPEFALGLIFVVVFSQAELVDIT